MEASVIYTSCISCSVEIKYDNSPYYGKLLYDVLLNNELIIKNGNINIFSIYDLEPKTNYKLTIIFETKEELQIEFKTKQVSEIINIYNKDFKDYSELIQEKVDIIKDNGLLIINEGDYLINSIFIKNNITIYIKKGCHLIAQTDRTKFNILEELKQGLPYGTWEGDLHKMFASIITGFKNENVNIVGEGTLDGNSQNSDWWINHKNIVIAARPRMVFLNNCKNISIQGITIQNSPCWTLHPFYSENINFIDLKVYNPKISPNTDGCNPESCTNVQILGCHFSVGDDCIAIKSGKISMIKDFYQPCNNITIRNCLMENGHGAIVLGSEISSGVTNLDVNNCLFINTDRGLRIKTRRGRGDKAIVNKIVFENIKMKNVYNAFVINMFYKCDSDGCSDYVQSRLKKEVNELTPYVGSITFKNIICEDTLTSGGYFFGLPEQKIKSIEFNNVLIQMKDNDVFMEPAMMCGIDKVNQVGLYFNNVGKVILNNTKIINQKGEDLILCNVDEVIRK